MVIQVGVPEPFRHQAARLYMEAFRRKLTPILGNDGQGIELLAQGLALEFGIAALLDGQLIGVAGIYEGHHHFANIRPFDLIQTFGWGSGLKRLILGMVLERSAAPEELVLDGIAVHQAWRGNGVGTALLKAVVTYAREHDFRTVRLDVTDTNAVAKKWYERSGFMTIKTHRTGWMTRRLGFEAVTTMVKVV